MLWLAEPVLNTDNASAAAQAADEVLAGSARTRVSALRLADQFGHPDLNRNEVLANRASLLVEGMGPLWDPPSRDGGKVFAGIHALYAGLVFVVASGLVFVPVLYRLWQKYRRDEAA